MPVIEAQVKAFEVARPLGRDARHQLLRRDALCLRLEHDRRPVSVVGTHEMHLMPAHPLKSRPDIDLDVLHDVADMERPVSVGQRGSDEELAGGQGHELRGACDESRESMA
jgi:hypothetical protein